MKTIYGEIKLIKSMKRRSEKSQWVSKAFCRRLSWPLGTGQSGLPDFALASLVEDQGVLNLAREAAEHLIEPVV